MAKRSSGERSVRVLRVGENIRHVLADVLRRDVVRDKDLFGVSITVTEVNVSPDLKNATIYILPLSGTNKEVVVEALNRSAGFLRGQLSKTIQLKYMPKLHFSIDRSFDEAGKMNALLSDPRVQQDLGKGAPDDDAEADDES